jgi:Beta-galactosidase
VNRRRFLFAAGTGITALATGARPLLARAARAVAPSGATSVHLSLAEHSPYRDDPVAKVQRRFALYRQLGFGILRTGIGWGGLERSEGNWEASPALKHYFAQAISQGFRLKLGAATLNAPPAWFLEAHPDARFRDAGGAYSKSLSIWYPGLYPLLAEKTDKVFGYFAQLGVLKAADFVLVDLGFAGQPTYPLRAVGHCQGSTPWFYDNHAQAAFQRAMNQKYVSVAHANQMWRTNFGNWAELRSPMPDTHPGPFWNDALEWYRDSKRRFIRWQVANYRRALDKHAPAGRRPILIIMVAGAHIRSPEWKKAVETGIPDCSLTIMSDSEFPMNLAKETGCWLQDTGVENVRELRYLRQYMQHHGIGVPMWGENAGAERVARNPNRLVNVILENGLYGLDYVDAHFLFESDGVTPNATFHAMADASRRLREALG